MREMIFAGFGGQGVLTSGLVIAYMAAEKNLNVVWMPSYGPTMRGGKANCVVKMGEHENESIGSPVMENADVLVAMNEPSLDYLEFCKKDALIIVNAAAVDKNYRFPEGTNVVFIDFPKEAETINNPKGQNIIAAGVVIKAFNLFDIEYAENKLCQMFDEKGKGKLNALNKKALRKGYELI